MDIKYLDESDYNGRFISSTKPVIAMIMSDYCGYCRMAKPEFERFNKLYGHLFTVAYVDIKDPRGINFLKKINYDTDSIRVPDYIRFKNGYLVPGEIKGRTVSDLLNFIK